MTEVSEIMPGVENVDRETFFSLCHNTRTQRGHPMKLIGERFMTNKSTSSQITKLNYGTHYHKMQRWPPISMALKGGG